ncbi:tetratricopeptide repeat protein [Anatilimnocola floriformis]|uniref:tetratricopeptide repeat protein n=1 Tax=Anatilimnocola floriformis TaxID=2948575 RepID=UPI0020C261D5|nr:hypothetical protein [Anatilimnocola floriformis]
MRTIHFLALLVPAIALHAGCSHYFPQKTTSDPLKKPHVVEKPLPTATKVLVDGPALALGQPEQDIAAKRQFVDRFQALIKENRFGAARLYVQRHPDLALDALRDAAAESADLKSQGSLAQAYDECCSATNSAYSWQVCMQTLAARPDALKNYRETRMRVMLCLRNGQFAEAMQIDLVRATQPLGQVHLMIEAYQLAGVSCMLADQPAGAAAAFQQAAAQARDSAPHQSAHVMLLLSEAQRRSGDNSGAVQTWTAATTLISNLLTLPKPLIDPTLWDRAVYLQPVGVDFPPQVLQNFTQLYRGPSVPLDLQPAMNIVQAQLDGSDKPSVPAIIAACLGTWRLNRHEAQQGLLLLKRAEALGTVEAATGWTRLTQAKALTALGQTSTSTALLIQLAGAKDNSPVSLAAAAELGSLKLHEGMTQQGLSLLRRGLTAQPEVQWPNRAAAEADLGLAYLMLGDEKNGMNWLERAQGHFRAQQDVEALAQTYWNQSKYFEHAKNKERMASCEQELRTLQF